MDTVRFTRMADGTAEEYAFLEQLEDQFNASLPDRLIAHLGLLEQSLSGYRVSRLEHCLQAATRAQRNGESDEMVVAALFHDIGDLLAPYAHGEMAAAVLRPYVSEKTHWIIKHHGMFQMYYYAHLTGGDRDARDQFRDHPWFEDAARFCELYDQASFDPDYQSEPLEHFEPMIRALFSEVRLDDAEHVARFGSGSPSLEM
jgi:predicted HD phosphohydrolase